MGQNLHDGLGMVEAFGTIADTNPHVQSVPNVLDHTTFVSFVLVTTGTLTGTSGGAWIVEASNDFVPVGGDKGQAPNAAGATWVNVTALFTPALAAVLTGGSKQYIQAQIAARALRVTFTATGGSGTVFIYASAKDM